MKALLSLTHPAWRDRQIHIVETERPPVRGCVRPDGTTLRVMMERLGFKDAEAVQQEIERFDVGHSRAMRAAFNFDWNDALMCHIVLNSARVPIDACVTTFCHLVRDPRFQDDGTIGAALANKLLETRVTAALSDEIGIGDAPAGITVSAANGRVTLMGASTKGNLRAKAEKVAFRVAGVCDIDNHISSVPSHGRF